VCKALDLRELPMSANKPECVQVVMRRAAKRTWVHLAAERLEDTKPTIPLGKSFWPLTSDERRGIELLFTTEEAGQLATSLHSRKMTQSSRCWMPLTG